MIITMQVRNTMDWDTARHEWSNHFAMQYSSIPTGRGGNAPEKKEFIKTLWEHKNENGEQFSIRAIGRLLRYKNGDHTTVRNHLIKMGLIT